MILSETDEFIGDKMVEIGDFKEEAKLIVSGTTIIFENANSENFGTITVAEGVLDIKYFDGTTALVRMGKFPIISAIAITDCWVIVGKTNLNVITTLEDKSRSRHVKWYDKSCWN